MNPSTGTFTTMDTYAGSIFDPVSLHKYLYANANPVMFVDPSGYTSLTSQQVAAAGMAVIAAIIVTNDNLAMNVYKNFRSSFASNSYFVPKYIFHIDDIFIMHIASGLLTSADINEEVSDEIVSTDTRAISPNNNITFSRKVAPPDTDKVKWSDKSRKQFNKKLPPDWRDKILKAIEDFLNGRSKHNDHALHRDYEGKRALDIPGAAPGRGTGRIIYEPIIEAGKIIGIKIVEFIMGHKY